MDCVLARIIANLDDALYKRFTQALLDYLENPLVAHAATIIGLVDAAKPLTAHKPGYDVDDFNHDNVRECLWHLGASDERQWTQLLDVLNDLRSREYSQFKAYSPFADKMIIFFDYVGGTATLKPEFEFTVTDELCRVIDVHAFPGNAYALVLGHSVFEGAHIVRENDDIPATI